MQIAARIALPLRSSLFLIIGLVISSLLLRFSFIPYASLIPEEAYYWNYAMHLDFGYLDHPPMVAFLIKASTLLFGHNEMAIRLPSMLCWAGTVYFCYRLTECICKEAGWHVVLLLSILPFFFLHSLIMTPDLPLMLSWAAALYYFYQAIVLRKPTAWYWAGLWCGLGLLSKYSMILLGVATILLIIVSQEYRFWLKRKEPWLAAFVALLIFSPVIYWNITHDWASFAFQGSRRFNMPFQFHLPVFIGLLAFFITLPGVLGLIQLFNKPSGISTSVQQFILYYALVPLLFFGIFSLTHPIKFNWIGPSVLAFVPWFALQIAQDHDFKGFSLKNIWLFVSVFMLTIYAGLLVIFTSGYPTAIHQQVFRKFIDWEAFTLDMHRILDTLPAPVILPLDYYNIASELNFYQQKLWDQKRITRQYPVVGQHIFNNNSLMYRYWTSAEGLAGHTVFLLAKHGDVFNQERIQHNMPERSIVQAYQTYSQPRVDLTLYYYQYGKWAT